MPINLLTHILNDQVSIQSTDQITCCISKQKSSVIADYYVYKQQNCIEKEWMFNDGIPTVIFLPTKHDNVQISTAFKQERFKSGWIDRGVQKNVYIHYPREFAYLLVLRFKPQAFNQLMGSTLKDVKNEGVLRIQSFLEDTTLDAFFSINSIEERIDYIDSHLSSCISSCANLAHLDQAIQIITAAKGQITVGDLTQKLGVNYKWLERNFSKHLQLTPKEYSSINRFIQAYLSLDKDSSDLLALAINHGFYDYNHFLKAFKSYTGQTPLNYLAK